MARCGRCTLLDARRRTARVGQLVSFDRYTRTLCDERSGVWPPFVAAGGQHTHTHKHLTPMAHIRTCTPIESRAFGCVGLTMTENNSEVEATRIRYSTDLVPVFRCAHTSVHDLRSAGLIGGVYIGVHSLF